MLATLSLANVMALLDPFVVNVALHDIGVGLHYQSDVSWPLASIPVSVLRAGSLHPASRGITLAPGDRVSLLVPATQDPQPQDTEPPGRGPGPGPADSPPTDGMVSPKSQPPPFGMTTVASQ